MFSGSSIDVKSMFTSTDYEARIQGYNNLLNMNPFVRDILKLNDSFVQGDFDTFLTRFNIDYNSLALQLYHLRVENNNDPIYLSMLNAFASILNNLNQGAIQYTNLQVLLYNYDACQESAAILNSISSIKAYLAKLMNESFIVSSNITAKSVVLKPEYSKYISLYGIPLGGVFDVTKMATILAELQGTL